QPENLCSRLVAHRRAQCVFTSFYASITTTRVRGAINHDGSTTPQETKMRKAIFLSTLALVLAVAASMSAGDHKENWAKMKAELNLTDAQVSELQQKFEEIRPQGEDLERRYKALHNEIESLEKASSPDQQAIQAKRSQLEAVTKEWHEKTTAIFRSVLT